MSIPELPDAAAAGGDGRGGRVQARVGRAELIEGHEGVGEGADETSGDGARRAGNERGRREGVDETRGGGARASTKRVVRIVR